MGKRKAPACSKFSTKASNAPRSFVYSQHPVSQAVAQQLHLTDYLLEVQYGGSPGTTTQSYTQVKR